MCTQSIQKRIRLFKPILWAGLLSIFAYAAQALLIPKQYYDTEESILASRLMSRAIDAIRTHCEQNGIPVDNVDDPNGTGLIGPRNSDITSTLGHVDAKRTTTNPRMAGLMVRLFREVGVSRGDTIVISASGSFPALLTASLCACQAMEIQPVVMISMGSSSYGASRPDFNLLHLYDFLVMEKFVTSSLAAVSLGGDKDVGQDFPPNTRQILIEQIKWSGIPFIHESDLRKNVSTRMSLLLEKIGSGTIKTFVNIGGSYYNLGTSAEVLNVKPGLNSTWILPPEEERGMLFEMASLGIPCIHMLFIKGIVREYDLAWDPVPLPKVPEESHLPSRSSNQSVFFLILALYFVFLGFIFLNKSIRSR